jgi:chaperone BCS1
MRYQGRWLLLNREKLNPGTGFGGPRALALERITIHCLGRSQTAVRELLNEAMNIGRRRDGRLAVFVSIESYWRQSSEVVPRPIESVILPTGMIENVLDDLTRFLHSEPIYRTRGIPYRRGYLLEGTPGSGKSSLIMALAGYFSRDLYVVNLASPKLTDAGLIELFLAIPEQALVLLEDVDAACPNRDSEKRGLTLTGLLNVLDGVVAKEGRLLFMTTNHAERLDAALVRPGRIDKRLRFGPAQQEQVVRLYQRFHPEAHVRRARLFAATVAEGSSMAEVQGMLLAETAIGLAATGD